MTASHFLNEHYFVGQPSSLAERENAAEHDAPGPSRQHDEMRPDSTETCFPLGTIQEIEQHIRLTYKNADKSFKRQAGANSFLSYLKSQGSSLAEVGTRELQHWALTPIVKGLLTGHLPDMQAFNGAKALCAVAAQVGHIDQQRARELAQCKRPNGDVNSLHSVLQNPALTPKEREYQIHLNFQSAEIESHRQTGASGLLAYLEKRGKGLAEVNATDLKQWALTIINSGPGKGKLPNSRAFEGAKGLCALAARVGYIEAPRAQYLAECNRPHLDVNSLRTILQNPALTHKEREYHIRLNYQSAEHNLNRYDGASALLAYLEKKAKALAEVTVADLEEWALTPVATKTGKSNMPPTQAFDGAKALCALAAQVGHIPAHHAKDIAEASRPYYYLHSLRTVLQNPALTPKEREHQIRLNYQSREKNSHRQAGASGLLAYLKNQQKSLAEVTTVDLERWALTPIAKNKGIFPSARAFEGAKALCALAAEVGELDPQQAYNLATCERPQFDLESLRTVLQNPALTDKEREHYIYLTFQSMANDPNRFAGASGILSYLERHASSLAELTTSQLKQWALTPIASGKAKGTLPSALVFGGAKGLCALAAQVGHIDAQRAKELAECARPQVDVSELRAALQNPILTAREREYHIRLTCHSLEKNPNRQAGANGFLAYLQSQQSSLAKVTKNNLERWALTPSATANGNIPRLEAFEGAKALCALAAEVGHIDRQTATVLAHCTRPQYTVNSLRMVLQNPTLTPKEREYQILLNFQTTAKNAKHFTGANGILTFLEKKGSSLAQVTTKELEEWALTVNTSGMGKGNLPNRLAFEGAKAFCALAAEVGHIDAQRAQDIARYTRPQFDLHSLFSLLQNPELTPAQRDNHIRLTYQSAETHVQRQAGASGLVAYLESQQRSLADVTTSDLEQWALTPITTGKRNLPSRRSFEGAKALCALAGQIGLLAPQRAHALAQCGRPMMDLNALRLFLQNPALSSKEREYRIRLTYQNTVNEPHRQAGASAILAYLDHKGSSLAELTPSDLEQWSLTPIPSGVGKGNLPNIHAFEGAKALCVLAAEVGHITSQHANNLRTCSRPRLDVGALRIALQNPALTPKEREYKIRLNYQSSEHNTQQLTGANGLLTYLESQATSLADVTIKDLEQWALTSIAGPGQDGGRSVQGLKGAKALCALAAKLGLIDPQRAQDIAECKLPGRGAQAPSERSCAIPERMQKRLKIHDQAASTSMTPSVALPQSDEWSRELALSHRALLPPAQNVRPTPLLLSQILIAEIESLENIPGSTLAFFSQSLQVKATISHCLADEPQSLQLAKDVLADQNPAAYQKLLELEQQLLHPSICP